MTVLNQLELNYDIAGLRLKKLLGRGSYSFVYEAEREDGSVFAVKVAREKDYADVTLKQYYAEAAILAQLDHAAYVKVHDVGCIDRIPYMVLERIDGTTLKSRIAAGPMDLDELVLLSRSLAEALYPLHRRGFIHRDLKPENLFWHSEQKVLRLIDLGLAAANSGLEPNIHAGTLQYMSPEQAGAMQRPLDQRSDLYTLGVVLFEAATARLPFVGHDSGTLALQHLKGDIPTITQLNPRISTEFAALIEKPMAKDPDSRFQDAKDLVTEIDRLSSRKKPQGVQAKITATFELIGRVSERQELAKRWNLAKSGDGSALLLLGESGCGKSSLMIELGQSASFDGALVVKAKCTPQMPFGSIRKVFSNLSSAVKANPHKAGEFYERLRHIANGKTGCLERHAKELAIDAEVQSSTGNSHDSDDPVQLGTIMARIGNAECPVLYLIDDIQWADEATLRTLENCVMQLRESNSMCLLTGRSDPESASNIRSFMERLPNGTVHTVMVESMPSNEAAELMSHTMGSFKLDEAFKETVYKQTQGNPFSILEYLRNVSTSGALFPRWGKWFVDWQRLESLDLPTNAIALVGLRIKSLPPPSRDFLKVAAVCGANFNAKHVQEACHSDHNVGFNSLLDGQSNRLIEKVDGDNWRFIHDRIQEALLGFIGDSKKMEIHQAIGEVLLKIDDRDTDLVTATAHHLVQGDAAKDPASNFFCLHRSNR